MTKTQGKSELFFQLIGTTLKFIMPDVNNITLKLVADKNTGLLLGCQGVGAGDADKRVNTITSAILAKMKVEDFLKNDITYAPPYSPTIDPLLNAGQMLQDKIKHG